MRLDSFLKLEGQEGLSTDTDHGGEFEVLTFHHRIHRGKDGEQFEKAGDNYRPKNAAIHGEITVFQPLGQNAVKLMQSICIGKQYASATLVIRGLGGTPLVYKDLYTLTAKQAVVTRVHYVVNPVFHRFGRPPGVASLSGNTGGPMVEVELLYFGQIKWDYDGTFKTADPGSDNEGG